MKPDLALPPPFPRQSRRLQSPGVLLLPENHTQHNILLIVLSILGMSTTKALDLSSVVLILGSFVGVDNILKLSDNSRYEFLPRDEDTDESWKGGQAGEQMPRPPFLCLRIGEHLFDPQGWVLGSHDDSDQCDLQLAENNQTGISRRSIRLDISPVTHYPRVTALTDKRISIELGNRSFRCRPDEPIELLCPATVDLGAVSFRAWAPERTAAEAREYGKLARAFSQDILSALPKYIPSIKSHPETEPHNVRYGRNGAVYVGGWRVESKGMHASVMMVKDRKTGRTFGAKEPYYRTTDNPDIARKRFETLQKEYKYIMQLDHVSRITRSHYRRADRVLTAYFHQPHIVKAYDLVVAEDVTLPPWMIVEYIPLNLRDAMPNLDECDRLTVMTHLSSALHYMHGRGITHRDVKPDNALVQRDDHGLTVKLADFGTSKHNESGKMDTFTGTEIYMAPELFETPRNYTNKIDLWALGLVGMHLFTSWSPSRDSRSDGNDFGPWMRGVIIPHMSEAPQQFRPFLKGLLYREPKRRWTAWKCLKWLWGNIHLDNPLDEHLGGREGLAADLEKRSAATLGGSHENDSTARRRRSPNPSLSTTRARTAHLTSQGPEEGSPLPDGLFLGTSIPELVSPALTPHADDAASESNDGGDADSTEEGNVSLEDDWGGDSGEFGNMAA